MFFPPYIQFSFSSSITFHQRHPFTLIFSTSHLNMRTSIMRKYYFYFVTLKYARPLVAGFAGINAIFYFQTSWQSYRLRKITTAAAQGILEPVGALLKELQSSEVEGKLPDFEFEAENDRGVRNKYAFRLVDGKVQLVKEEPARRFEENEPEKL